jgi:CxxC motif-containing protein
MKELICIICPKGCRLQVDEQNDLRVEGNACARGAEYGKAEIKNPTRTVTSTVRVAEGRSRRCPVKTDRPVPKAMIADALRQLYGIEVRPPVHIGQVIVKNICGTQANFVSTRNL